MKPLVMLNSEQINEYLNSALLSYEDYENMYKMFQQLAYDDYKVAMFKLYNEEISLSEMASSATIDLSSAFIMRRIYIRNQLITMSYQYYKDENNIDKQLEIVSNILTDDEKTYLKNNLSYFDLYGQTFDESKYYLLLKNLVRIDNENNNHAYIELHNINKFSDDLNNSYISNSNPLVTILGKLNKCTLHN